MNDIDRKTLDWVAWGAIALPFMAIFLAWSTWGQNGVYGLWLVAPCVLVGLLGFIWHFSAIRNTLPTTKNVVVAVAVMMIICGGLVSFFAYTAFTGNIAYEYFASLKFSSGKSGEGDAIFAMFIIGLGWMLFTVVSFTGLLFLISKTIKRWLD